MTSRTLRFAAVVHAALLAGVLCAPASGQNYPRLGLYGSIQGTGYPFLRADSTLDPVVLGQVARYGEVVLDVNPITPYRPDILAGLRSRNPSIRLLAYVLGDDIWPAESADSLVNFPTRYNHLVRRLGGYLYNSVDGTPYSTFRVNLAKVDGLGHYVLADSIADLFATVLATGQWDGMFLDVFCSSLIWTQDGAHQIDYVRAGYASLSTFDAAYQAGANELANRLRADVGPGLLLVGNCAASTHTAVFNGWMREDFPLQGGGTWYTNILADPHGYLADDRDFVQPPHNYIFSAAGNVSTPTSADNTRRVRFGLGSAALGAGLGVFGPSDRSVTTAPYHTWWYDEYSVDISTGAAQTDLAHTGWLGAPLGAARQVVWPGTNPDASTNPDFETDVTSGWSFGVLAPAAGTIVRDVTTAAVGVASAHVNVSVTGPNPWSVNLATTSTLPLVVGQSYAATFWAKASPSRTLPVVATLLTSGQAASANVTVDGTWRQFQVVLQPSVSASVVLEFFLGQQAGDIWFDDVHFQQGVTSLYRRDFQNGIVLVNPAPTEMQVPLGAIFHKIGGMADLVTNDGSSVSTATVPPSDALFLIGPYLGPIAPAAITDLRASP